MSESLDDFFTINVTSTTDTQSRAGFGTALLAVAKVPWTSGARVREFTSIAALAAVGFLTTDPAYQMTSAAFAQNPRPVSVKIGQRTRLFTQVVRLTPSPPVSGTAAEAYTAKVDGLTCAYTTSAAPTVAEACTGLAAAINALCGVSATAILATGGASSLALQTLTGAALNGSIGVGVMAPPRRLSLTFSAHANWLATTATINGTDQDGNALVETFAIPAGGGATVNGLKYFRTVTSIVIPIQGGALGTFTVGVRASVTADGTSGTSVLCTSAVDGLLHSYELVTGNLSLKDETADPGITADLNELLALDPDFYALAIDSNSQAEIASAAAWAASIRRLFVYQSADSGCGVVATTTDVMSVLKAASYGYATGWFYPSIATATGWLAVALLGNRLPADPGSDTWAFKTLAGVTVLPLSTAARSAILAKNGNVYERKNGKAVTFPGKTALGDWVDVTRGLDWVRARMQEALFALQTTNGKIPFTDEGIRLIAAAIYSVLSAGVDVKLFAADPKPTVTAPRASAVSSANRSARTLPSVTFTAQLAGAIHTLTVTGTASA